MDKSFDIPISVVIGVSTAHDLRSLEEVHAFLNDWPHSRRGPIHGTALRACKAAMEGSVPAETARQAFVGFARTSHILLPEVAPVVAGRMGKHPRRDSAV
jgi:hypothetical protein